MDIRKAQAFTIRYSGLDQPTIHYGEACTIGTYLNVNSYCSYTCRGSSSSSELSKIKMSVHHTARLQRYKTFPKPPSDWGNYLKKCFENGF